MGGDGSTGGCRQEMSVWTYMNMNMDITNHENVSRVKAHFKRYASFALSLVASTSCMQFKLRLDQDYTRTD